jgi:hypothetical protein
LGFPFGVRSIPKGWILAVPLCGTRIVFCLNNARSTHRTYENTVTGLRGKKMRDHVPKITAPEKIWTNRVCPLHPVTSSRNKFSRRFSIIGFVSAWNPDRTYVLDWNWTELPLCAQCNRLSSRSCLVSFDHLSTACTMIRVSSEIV